MKILKHGRNSSIEYFECPNCGCQFEADKSECESYYGTPFVHPIFGEEVRLHQFFCNCPECGEKIKSDARWENKNGLEMSVIGF